MMISFSGLDGAGKTTHIELTTRYLELHGHKVKVLRMYDHVSVSAFLRKRLRRRSRGSSPSQRAKATKSSPIPETERVDKSYRYDKNRKGFGIVTMRQLVYLADLLVLLAMKLHHEGIQGYTIVCDRHLIDSLVNLSNTNRIAAMYSRAMLALMPEPDLPILIDIEAEVAFKRKPEYPLAYNIERREAYLNVFRRLKNAVVVSSTTIPEVQQEIERNIDLAVART